MRMLTRLLSLATLAVLMNATLARAQQVEHGIGSNQWYIGAHGGVLIFETAAQERGGMPMAGGHLLVTVKRTGLLVSVDEGFGDNERSAYADTSAIGGTRGAAFNNIRKYSFILMAFPIKKPVTPFFGVGFGIIHAVNPQPLGPFGSPTDMENAAEETNRRGSSGFGSFVGGFQFRVSRVAAFGQYQITSSPSRKLLIGPTHSFAAGVRVGLGGAKEGITGGNY